MNLERKKKIIDNMQIYIAELKGKISFVNESNTSFKEISYSTGSFFSDVDTVIQSAIPRFRLRDIPAKSYVIIEDVDVYEDGRIIYSNAKFVETNGEITEVRYLKKIEILPSDPFPGKLVERELEEIS